VVKKLILATLVAAAAAVLVASVAPTQYTDGGSRPTKRSSAQPGYAAPQTQAVPAKNAYGGANKTVNFQQSSQQQSDPYGYGQQQGGASTSGQAQQGQGYGADQASGSNQSSAAGKDVKLATSLVGSEEKPGPGDPAGSGQAWVTVKTDNSVCYKVTWSGLGQPATAAHIHKGVKGLPGDVVVPFFGNGKQPSGKGSDENCVQVPDLAVVEGLRKNPQDYYVNVHTAQFPQGAIRGQLAFASRALPETGAERTPVMLGLGFGVLAAGFAVLAMFRYRPRRLAVGGAHTRRR
jgi:LPXTG-motif cell wall-anchored protein